jgi:hypothetical protein
MRPIRKPADALKALGRFIAFTASANRADHRRAFAQADKWDAKADEQLTALRDYLRGLEEPK